LTRKWDKTDHSKRIIFDSTSPKCAEYLFEKDGYSSFLIKCCLKNSQGLAIAKLMDSFKIGFYLHSKSLLAVSSEQVNPFIAAVTLVLCVDRFL
jgi:hypothetical protein